MKISLIKTKNKQSKYIILIIIFRINKKNVVITNAAFGGANKYFPIDFFKKNVFVTEESPKTFIGSPLFQSMWENTENTRIN